jgi:hypothetical protein
LLLIYRSNLLLAWAILALPGVITHAPIFIPAKMYSKVKAKGIYLVTSIYPCKRADFWYHLAEALAASSVKIAARDVIATWKILFSLAATPALYIVYAILATWLAWRNGASSAVVKSMPALIFIIMPFFAMSSLKFGEAGMDVFKSVHPCLLTPNITAHPPSLQIITTTFPVLVARKSEGARKIAQNPRIARQRAVRGDQLVAHGRIKFSRATNWWTLVRVVDDFGPKLWVNFHQVGRSAHHHALLETDRFPPLVPPSTSRFGTTNRREPGNDVSQGR